MIQRIQTLFLLLVAGLSGALFFVPSFITKTATANTVRETPFMIQSNLLIAIVVSLSGVIALVIIFLYKNRQRQMLLCRLNMLFIIGASGLILQASDTSSLPLSSDHITIQYLFPVYLPLAQIVLDLLAIRFIKKDDDLVRSADRLR